MPNGEQSFHTTVQAAAGKVSISLPFDVAGAWGARSRYHVSGTVNGHKIRGPLTPAAGNYGLPLGPAWRRDTGIAPGDEVSVVLWPEGPQAGDVAADLAAALEAAPDASAFFEGLPSFYRKGYVRWIESARRPETRAHRIAETIQLLREHRRER
ncbi:MAG TPA: YdeI/OmpD-associated family protein [Dehalococcoidia bacterium]